MTRGEDILVDRYIDTYIEIEINKYGIAHALSLGKITVNILSMLICVEYQPSPFPSPYTHRLPILRTRICIILTYELVSIFAIQNFLFLVLEINQIHICKCVNRFSNSRQLISHSATQFEAMPGVITPEIHQI